MRTMKVLFVAVLAPTLAASPASAQPHAHARQRAAGRRAVAHRPVVFGCCHGLSRCLPRQRRAEVPSSPFEANRNPVPTQSRRGRDSADPRRPRPRAGPEARRRRILRADGQRFRREAHRCQRRWACCMASKLFCSWFNLPPPDSPFPPSPSKTSLAFPGAA